MASVNHPKRNGKLYRLNNGTSVVTGEFSSLANARSISTRRLNKFLACSLLSLIFLSMISYFGVMSKYGQIQKLNIATTEMNLNNMDLQFKVSHSKSFYFINKQAQEKNNLVKPSKILTVNEINKNISIKDNSKLIGIAPVKGF